MNKEDFIESFPDVCEQVFEYRTVLSHGDFEKKAILISNTMQTGLIAYEARGKRMKMFTSYKLYAVLNQISLDMQVYDWEGELHTIIALPFMCGGECCIRTRCQGLLNVYSVCVFDWELAMGVIKA